jgi:hypothetical protein
MPRDQGRAPVRPQAAGISCLTPFPFCAMKVPVESEKRDRPVPGGRYRCRTGRFPLPIGSVLVSGATGRAAGADRRTASSLRSAGNGSAPGLRGSAGPGSQARPTRPRAAVVPRFDVVIQFPAPRRHSRARALTHAHARPGSRRVGSPQVSTSSTFPSGGETNMNVTGRASSPRHCDPGLDPGEAIQCGLRVPIDGRVACAGNLAPTARLARARDWTQSTLSTLPATAQRNRRRSSAP